MHKAFHRRGRLCEKVGEIVRCGNEGHTDAPLFYKLADVKVAAIDVLGARMVFGVVSKVDGCFVVEGERRGGSDVASELGEELA